MKSHEHRRSPRQAPVDARTPEEAALARAITLARVLRWREEWQAEIAARQARKEDKKANGKMTTEAAPRPQRRDGNGRYAAGIARSEFGRFYWDEKRAAPPAKTSRDGPAKKKKVGKPKM